MSKFTDTVARNTPKGTHLCCGWPAEEFRQEKTAEWVCNACEHRWHETITGHNVVRGDFDDSECGECGETLETRIVEIEDETDYSDELGFSHEECDTCGALAGDRYAVTALPDDPKQRDNYYALKCCGDCLQWIANGEEPCDD